MSIELDVSVQKIIGRTLEHEGGYVNDPNDAGGETNFGISKRSYPTLDIRNLTREAAIEIYKRDYYDAARVELLDSVRVRWKVFDIQVNTGKGVRILQRALGLSEDGMLGPQTAAVANAVSVLAEGALLIKIAREQARHYGRRCVKDPTDVAYLDNWLRRAFDFGEGLG
jgi:lysozyme family protein